MIAAALIALAALWAAGPAAALDCRNMSHDGNRYTICEVDMARDDLRLFLTGSDGAVLGQFSTLDAELAKSGLRLTFAMNAGMYHRDRAPVGHFVDQGKERMRVITTPGPGNFGLLPNGIFCIRPGRADVIETLAFLDQPRDCSFATQSGPMLVIDGALHPRFLPDSTSRHIRNGVGTTADGGHAVFAISDSAVTFHEFGRLFRDGLGLPNALYLDGSVSRLYAPSIGRADAGFALGPILGVVTPQ